VSQISTPADANEESSPRYPGWRVAFACFLMALFTWGFGFYGHAVYLAELQKLHGWSAGLIAGASTVAYLAGGVLVIFVHDAIGRLGPKRFVLTGAIAFGIGIALLAFVRAPWHLYAVYLLMSLGWMAMGAPAISIILGCWFERRLGLAISLALNGASFGGIAIAPLLVVLIGVTDFATTMLLAAALLAVVLLPGVLLWVDRSPARAEAVRDSGTSLAIAWTRRTAIRSPAFWSVSGPFALGLLAQVGFIVHQIAFLEPTLGRALAGFAVVVTTIMAVVGRLGLGALVDRLDPRWAAVGSFGSQAAALVVMAFTGDAAVLLVCCAVYGFSVGNLITLPPLILQREFAPASFGMLMGLSTSIAALTSALGPGLVGLVHDATGGYATGLLLCAALDIAAAGVVLFRPGGGSNLVRS
jgi:MFS family permease